MNVHTIQQSNKNMSNMRTFTQTELGTYTGVKSMNLFLQFISGYRDQVGVPLQKSIPYF